MDRIIEVIKQAHLDYLGLKGGTGSGNFGHSGIPGKVGGSAPGSGGGGARTLLGQREDLPDNFQAPGKGEWKKQGDAVEGPTSVHRNYNHPEHGNVQISDHYGMTYGGGKTEPTSIITWDDAKSGNNYKKIFKGNRAQWLSSQFMRSAFGLAT